MREVAGDRVIGQLLQLGHIAAGGEELKRADPDVAGRDAGEHCAGQSVFAVDGFPGGRGGQGPGRRNAQGVHGFAENVLAEHRAERGFAIAAPGERGSAGAFELDVAALSVGIDHFAEQQRAAVA